MSEARDRYDQLRNAEPFDLIHICMAADRLITELEADKAELISLIQELKDSAEYWSEYEVPIGIVDRIREAVKKHGGEI